MLIQDLLIRFVDIETASRNRPGKPIEIMGPSSERRVVQSANHPLRRVLEATVKIESISLGP